MSDRYMTVSARDQRGAVLVVTLVTLLLVTLITFATASSSIVNSRIAVAQEIKTTSFQAAESTLIRMAQTNILNFPDRCIQDPVPAPALLDPGITLTTASGDTLAGRGVIVYRRPGSKGTLRRGAAGGVVSYQFDLIVTATSDATGAETALTRAIYIDAPAPQGTETGYERCN